MRSITITGHPFSRSYGVILPSSLTRVRSNTLGYSPRPPVSVCGTVCALICLEAISRRRIYMDFADCSSSCTSEYVWHGFACATSYMHSTAIPTAVSTAPSRHSIAQHTGPGILTWLPSASPALSLLMPTWSLAITPASLTGHLRRNHNALLPATLARCSAASVRCLKSRSSSVLYHSTSELLRTL